MKDQQYKIIISYDGTGFVGWLAQPDEPSIMGALQNSFHHVFAKKIQILGASKTDAGVHALGQVAIFKTDLAIEPKKMRWAWNKALPESIKIISLESNDQFNPHANVIDKTYWYYFSSEKPSPFFARYCWHYRLPFDEKLINKALQVFIGTHDFEHFYKGDDRVDTIRTIKNISFEFVPAYNAYRITIVGEKFLRHMVRRMVGAALHVGAGKIDLSEIKSALNKSASSNLLPTSPAKGLLLKKISYSELGSSSSGSGSRIS